MRKILSIISLLVVSLAGHAQTSEASEPFPTDTVMSGEREVVLFSNNTWQYLEDISFDGIMNQELHDLITEDTSLHLKTYWDNNMCFSNQNNTALMNMKDSVWICVTDSLHPNFAIPVPGVLTSSYKHRGGRWHHGVDLDLRTGDTIVAAFSGKVRYAKYNTHGYGNLVIVRHYNGLETYYAHMSKLLVTPNQYVVAGQTLGLGGATGHAYGAHLHFETRFYDASINPEEIFDFKNRTLKDCNLVMKAEHFKRNRGAIAYRQASPNKTYASTGRYHRIRSGDSLWKISRMYGTTVSKLCQLNGISESATLQVGKTLKVK